QANSGPTREVKEVALDRPRRRVFPGNYQGKSITRPKGQRQLENACPAVKRARLLTRWLQVRIPLGDLLFNRELVPPAPAGRWKGRRRLPERDAGGNRECRPPPTLQGCADKTPPISDHTAGSSAASLAETP